MKEKIQVVYGKRVKRNGETKFKLLTAHVFYRLLNSICDVTIPSDTGDFRLMRKDVIDTLRKLPERHRFVRGLVPWLGFTSVPFEYHRPERYAGSTKYPFTKMFQLAMTAILSFSVLPLRAVSIIGGISLGLSIVLGIVFLAMKLFTNQFLPGYASTILIVLFMGSVQILLTGVMAEYMAKIFEEIKGRPLYVLKTCLNFSKDSTLVNSLPYRRGDDEYDKTEDNNFNSDITVFPLSPKDVA
jgi:dolichol-phosphate mannosyltransferase